MFCQFVLCIAILVLLGPVLLASMIDVNVVGKGMLQDPNCSSCVGVHSKVDSIIADVIAAQQKLGNSSRPHDELLFNCSRTGGKPHVKDVLQLACAKKDGVGRGGAIKWTDAANLLIRRVCEAGGTFKLCSRVMNTHRDAIHAYLVEHGGGSNFCWYDCEGKLSLLEQMAIRILTYLNQRRVKESMEVMEKYTGVVAIGSLTGVLLGVALFMRAAYARTPCVRGGNGQHVPTKVVTVVLSPNK